MPYGIENPRVSDDFAFMGMELRPLRGEEMNLGGGHPQPREEVAAWACRHGGDRPVEEGDFPKQTRGPGEQAPTVRRVGEGHPRRSRGRWCGRQ